MSISLELELKILLVSYIVFYLSVSTVRKQYNWHGIYDYTIKSISEVNMKEHLLPLDLSTYNGLFMTLSLN